DEPEQGELGVGALVVDAHSLTIDVLADDGQEGRLLAGQGDGGVDGVLKVVPQLRRRRCRLNGLGKAHMTFEVLADTVGVEWLLPRLFLQTEHCLAVAVPIVTGFILPPTGATVEAAESRPRRLARVVQRDGAPHGELHPSGVGGWAE